MAVPSGQGDCGVTEGKVVPHLLRIDFNDADVVTGWDKSGESDSAQLAHICLVQ